jgi:hypothetical protein
MKTKEEIEKLATNKYGTSIYSIDEVEAFKEGYTQCQKDMADNFLSLIEEYREKELPNKDVPYHYEAEIDSGLKYLIMFIKNKQD